MDVAYETRKGEVGSDGGFQERDWEPLIYRHSVLLYIYLICWEHFYTVYILLISCEQDVKSVKAQKSKNLIIKKNNCILANFFIYYNFVNSYNLVIVLNFQKS